MFFFSGSTGRSGCSVCRSCQEGWLAEETWRIHRRLARRKGGPTSRGGRGEVVRPPAPSSHGHVRLHPVSALRPEVQRVRRRSPHPEVQRHQEQQALKEDPDPDPEPEFSIKLPWYSISRVQDSRLILSSTYCDHIQ